MNLPLLLPSIVNRLRNIEDLGSAQASNSLQHALALDHDQRPYPKAIVFLSSLHTEASKPMLAAYQLPLHWIFGILLSLRTGARFGQDQWIQQEKLTYQIITQLEGILLGDDLSPLHFIDGKNTTEQDNSKQLDNTALNTAPSQIHSLLRFRTCHHHLITQQ